MSNYMNEAGEPYMTAAALRFEASLDEQYAYERMSDEFYNDFADEDYNDPDDCPHEDGTFLGSSLIGEGDTRGDFRCDQCDTIVGTWTRGADGWPERD